MNILSIAILSGLLPCLFFTISKAKDFGAIILKLCAYLFCILSVVYFLDFLNIINIDSKKISHPILISGALPILFMLCVPFTSSTRIITFIFKLLSIIFTVCLVVFYLQHFNVI